jgi:hypothetical protein
VNLGFHFVITSEVFPLRSCLAHARSLWNMGKAFQEQLLLELCCDSAYVVVCAVVGKDKIYQQARVFHAGAENADIVYGFNRMK